MSGDNPRDALAAETRNKKGTMSPRNAAYFVATQIWVATGIVVKTMDHGSLALWCYAIAAIFLGAQVKTSHE